MSYQQKDSRPSKARIKSPPLSGGEVARKTEEKGRGLSERSEFRRPRRRLRRQTQKPDNRGGASWFVLLAVEKNEQIKRINVTRTFFDRERKSLVFNLLPLPCPEALRCVAQKNIGEVARSDGGVNKNSSPNGSFFSPLKRISESPLTKRLKYGKKFHSI